MSDHPAIKTVVERIHTDAIGGAADIAKEVVAALAQMAGDSKANDAAALTAEFDAAVRDILRVLPSFAPPVNALHRMMGRMEVLNGASAADLKAEVGRASDDF